jgi:3-dehydroquinate synthase
MENMKKIAVNLGERSYNIIIMPGLLDDLSNKLAKIASKKNVLIITDDNVSKLYGEKVLKAINSVAAKATIASIPPGEASKTLANVQVLYSEAIKAGLDRSSLIVALGGGVVGDIAGFTAATYMRGIDLLQIPTSLLAMVDSSVGGKTGVDLPDGKNLIGAFWQPKKVLIDTETLQTLPKRETSCGLAEAIKYGMIFDDNFFSFLESKVKELNTLDYETYTSVIARCCQLKADIVEKDEREESGLRAVLNYGHTFAHAIETITDYTMLNHGEAVAIGMCMAASLAVADGRLDDAAELRQENLLRRLHLPCTIEKLKPSQILSAMSKDKKTVAGKLRFVLPDTIGEATLAENIEKELILDAIGNCCD